MRKLLQALLTKPVLWLVSRFTSKPDIGRVHAALTKLNKHINNKPGDKGLLIETSAADCKFIIFSDQHKGAKNGSDDFMKSEPNYLAALEYYYEQGFHFISLGDEEELWENSIWSVKAKNKNSIELQEKFLLQKRYTKVFGNHDLYWDTEPFAGIQLLSMYDQSLKVYEGVVLKIKTLKGIVNMLLTHGHQGDGRSDGNWFSAWFVARIWAPLQSFLQINPNVPASNNNLKTLHNYFMYEWSKLDNNPVLITGHTHQPVFASLTKLEQLYKDLDAAKNIKDESAIAVINKAIKFNQTEYDFVTKNYTTMKPYYFNTGCCCFLDGDITGIEIADEKIRLIKWHLNNNISERIVLNEMMLEQLV